MVVQPGVHVGGQINPELFLGSFIASEDVSQVDSVQWCVGTQPGLGAWVDPDNARWRELVCDVIEMRSGWVLTPNPEPFSLFDKK